MIRSRFSALFLFCLCILGLSAAAPDAAFAQTASTIQAQIDANNQQLASLQNQIAAYQQQLNTLKAEKNTLQSTISALTISQKQLASQVQLTQNKIASANLQIIKLTQSIGDKETTITEDQDAVGKTLRSMDQNEQASLVIRMISTDSFADAWQVTDEAIQFNQALLSHMKELRAARAALADNRDAVTDVKKDLVSLQAQLTAQNKSIVAKKIAQQQLLAQTKNSEANYQKLLATAQAELASFSAFTSGAGGAKLLANQTVCDSWGCYYNQRDTLWGNLPLNGTKFRLASDGCLVASMAMVMTHYGYRNVTPVTINANPDNFASYYPAYLLFTINVGGVTATRKAAAIDATLATGHPVVVGVRAYGGTHFVVLVSGSRGSYLMRDPYVANGKDISFSAHYSVSNIYAINKVILSS